MTGKPPQGPDLAPLRLEGGEVFATVRDSLAKAGFTETRICHRFRLSGLHAFSPRAHRPAHAPNDLLEFLVLLFLGGETLAVDVAQTFLTPGAVEAFETLGLVAREPTGDGSSAIRSGVLLYPVGPLFIASDRPPLGQSGGAIREDLVYPALTPNTQRFLAMLPQDPCDSFLELCAGTGVAALMAAPSARHAWAFDISPRAVHFAEFNRRLNGVPNLTAAAGGLWEPASGLTFDRIVAHPPYLPALRQRHVFRDGGEDGELVTASIVRRLPEFLRPGGALYCTTMGSDRADAPFESRLRRMLGPLQHEFDIVLATHEVFTPFEYYLRLAVAGEESIQSFRDRDKLFRQLGIERLLTCSILIRRRSSPALIVTARRQAGPCTSAAEMRWLLEIEGRLQSDSSPAAVLDSRLLASPHTKLAVTHGLENYSWKATECVLKTDYPFALRAQVMPWAAALLANCDGSSARVHLRRLQRSFALPQSASEADLAAFVRTLMRGGFVYDAEHPLPGPAAEGDRDIRTGND